MLRTNQKPATRRIGLPWRRVGQPTPWWMECTDSPELTETLKREADGALFQMFSAKNLEDPEEKGATKRKLMIFGAGGAGTSVLLLIVTMSTFHGTKPAAKHSVPPPAEVTDTQPSASSPAQPGASTPTPAPSEPLTQQKPPASTQKQQKTNNPAASNEKKTKPAQAQSEMMNDQLTAPRMISRDAQKQVAEDAPPPASPGADGLGGSGANVGVFNGHGQPAVKAVLPKAITVSSGVANGMLIEKTPLVYPAIAKAAQVSGTVELHATISKTGTIKDLQFVNGPAMLRQAALDAVRTWRYKPFELNNEPTEIATTINVVFTLRPITYRSASAAQWLRPSTRDLATKIPQNCPMDIPRRRQAASIRHPSSRTVFLQQSRPRPVNYVSWTGHIVRYGKLFPR